jgi:predicted nucleic acid-binding protein
VWPLEVANALTILRRRRKLTVDEARSAIEIIRELPIVIEQPRSRSHASSIWRQNMN